MYDATWLLKLYAHRRLRKLANQSAEASQEQVLRKLIRTAQHTRFGKDHGFQGIRNLNDYRQRVPLRDYDALWTDYWRSSFPLLRNCTWPGLVPWFAETSGTTTGTTKFIPLGREMLRSNSIAGADLLAHYLAGRPHSRLLAGRFFMLGGSTSLARQASGVYSGDLSGISAATMPAWARLRYFPPPHLEVISDWQEKIDNFARCSLEEEITAIAGVPSWMLIFFERLATSYRESGGGIDHVIADIYPQLELLVHGGIAWTPYVDRFKSLLAGSDVQMREVYTASEGFFAVADREADAGLRLLLDTGIYYEFVPLGEIGKQNPNCRWIADVEVGVNYALIVTTCAGLWRYIVGDTVKVVDLDPPRLVVTGRISYMLSVCGEHVIGSELEAAIAMAAASIDVSINDFAVGPVFPDENSVQGGHLFVVEFETKGRHLHPDQARCHRFARRLDEALSSLNDDYAAHRAGGYGMRAPQALVMRKGGFAAWMQKRGKLGGQNKVPRIINDRTLFADLRKFAESHEWQVPTDCDNS